MLHWKELRPCISLIPQEAVPRELFLQKSKEDDTNIKTQTPQDMHGKTPF